MAYHQYPQPAFGEYSAPETIVPRPATVAVFENLQALVDSLSPNGNPQQPNLSAGVGPATTPASSLDPPLRTTAPSADKRRRRLAPKIDRMPGLHQLLTIPGLAFDPCGSGDVHGLTLTPSRANLTPSRANFTPSSATSFSANTTPFNANITPFNANLTSTPFNANLLSSPFNANLTFTPSSSIGGQTSKPKRRARGLDCQTRRERVARVAEHDTSSTHRQQVLLTHTSAAPPSLDTQAHRATMARVEAALGSGFIPTSTPIDLPRDVQQPDTAKKVTEIMTSTDENDRVC